MLRTVRFQAGRCALLFGALALAGCNSESTTTPPQIGSIRVTGNATSVVIGSDIQLQAVARDPDGVPLTGVTFTWASENNAIATVGSTGLVHGVSIGTVNITAEAGGVQGILRVAVQSNQSQ
ncbi:MAG TPA: Ig-like domain-containing protein [Gemmatimonadaceae bacterium]|nr:Ig-like domain-containing protein [Gemmatimonadaceae bacterium]